MLNASLGGLLLDTRERERKKIMGTTVALCCLLMLSLISATRASTPTTAVVVRSLDQFMARMNGGSGPECKDFFEEHCPIGCNGRIGENALFEDECGVCGGDGSTCDNGGGDDEGCDSTCIALVVGIPLGILALLILLGLIIFFASAGNRRRTRRRGRTLILASNEQYRPSQLNAGTHYYHQPSVFSAHHHRKRPRKNNLTEKTSAIRWTNGAPHGWNKGDKYY